MFNETEGDGSHIFEELRKKYMKEHVQPNVSLVATEIPLFKISQEDIDNRIYIEPDSEKTDMSIPKYDKKRDKMQVIIVGQKSWVIVNCNN